MQNIWKKNAKLMLILLLDIFIISGATYAATTMYQSNTVGYDNTTSGLRSTNVQGALDEVYSAATNYAAYETRLAAVETSVSSIETNFLNKVYPVGSIYLSTNLSTVNEVANAIGGTWEVYGSGRTLVGVGSNGTDTYAINATGGSSSTAYTPAGTVENTTLTVDQIPSHRHSIPALSGTAASAGSEHSHTLNQNTIYYSGSSNASVKLSTGASGFGTFAATKTDGAHTHSVTTTASNTGYIGGGGAHNHGFTGTQATISTQDPYITVYMYKRIS